MADTLLKMVEGLARFAFEAHGQVDAYLALLSEKDVQGKPLEKKGVLILAFADDCMASGRTKSDLHAFMTEAIRTTEAEACAFVSEVWVKHSNIADHIPGGDLSEDHDLEGVMVVYQERGRPSQFWFAEIKRPEGEPPRLEGLKQNEEMIRCSGRFSDLMGALEVN